MRRSVGSAALAAAIVPARLAAGTTPARAQDFSITSPEPPADGSLRDVLSNRHDQPVPAGYTPPGANLNGTTDFTYETETVPAPTPTWWSVIPGPSSPDDPP